MSACSTSSRAIPTAGCWRRPSEWNERSAKLRSSRSACRAAASGPAPGIGDRVLAKIFPTDDRDRPGLYRPRHEGVRQARARPCSASSARCTTARSASSRSSARQPELIVEPEFRERRQGRRSRRGRAGLAPAATACRAPRSLAVLGSLTSEKAVSMIAIHAHDIPHIFPADVLAEAEAAQPADHGRARGLARPAAGHHRSGRRQGP